MTCKDCVHCSVCKSYDNNTIRCNQFQNKSNFVNVVRCKDCKHFGEYTEQHKATVERADGDCFIHALYSEDRQFWSVQYDDFCSCGERKEAE